MKALYFFYTKPRMYLTLLPLVAVLVVSILNNGIMTGPVKLYPLIIASGGSMIFILIYLFRLVKLSTEEIRSIGPYSTKESTTLEEGKTLVMTLRPKHKLKLEVVGRSDGGIFSWSGDGEVHEINVYRDIVNGGKRTVARILRYYGVSDEDVRELISGDATNKEYGHIAVTKSGGDEGDTYSVYFKVTI